MTQCQAVQRPKKYSFLGHWKPKDEDTMRNHSPQQSHIPEDLNPQIPFLSLWSHLFLQKESPIVTGYKDGPSHSPGTATHNILTDTASILNFKSVSQSSWLFDWLAG